MFGALVCRGAWSLSSSFCDSAVGLRRDRSEFAKFDALITTRFALSMFA